MDSLNSSALVASAEDRLVRTLKRLALGFALLVTLGLPGGYFSLQYANHADHVGISAQLTAADISSLATADPGLWASRAQTLQHMLRMHPPWLDDGDGDDMAALRDTAGNLIATMDAPLFAPVMIRSAPVYSSERLVGWVDIAHSFRDVVFGTLLAGLLGLLLGGAVYAMLLLLPLRALRAREERYQLLFNRASDGIMILSPTGKILEVNESFARMHGYHVEDMLNMRLEDMDTPETLQLAPERLRSSRSEESISFEAEHYHKDGHVFPLEVSISQIVVGNETLLQAFHRDITARKAADAKLQRHIQFYAALSQCNEAIVRCVSEEELFPQICHIAVQFGGMKIAWIGFVDTAASILRPAASFGDDPKLLRNIAIPLEDDSPFGLAPLGTSFSEGRPYWCQDFLNNSVAAPWREHIARYNLAASASLPLHRNGVVVGAFILFSDEANAFDEQVRDLLVEMAMDISFALDNYAREAARRKAEGALREGEERYRRLFEANPYPMWVFDTATLAFLAANDAAVAHYGWSREEFQAMTIADIRPAEDIPVLLGHLATHKETNFTTADSTRHRKKDGTLIDVEIATHIIDFGGRRARIVSAHDITERKLMERQLRDSIAFQESLLQAMPLPVFHKDAAGFYTGCNIAFAEFIGKNEDDIVGKTVYEVSPQSFARTYRDKDIELLDSPVGMQVYESRVMHADGTAHDVIFHKARISDNAGRAVGIVGTITDITARKAMEEALRAAEEQFRGLVEQSIAGIYIIQDGKFAYVNPRFAEIRGFSAVDELIGRAPMFLIAEKDRGAVAEHNRRLLAGEKRDIDYSFTALRKDGSNIEVGVHSSLASYHGRPAIIGLLQDISEKKRAEEAIQHYIAQLKTAFMSTVQVATTLSELRDPYTAGHERRVGAIAVALGAELGFDEQRLEGLRVAGYLHDIGKIIIPSEILSKPGKLGMIEYQLIQGHAQASYDVLKTVEWPWPVAEVALQHHERMDGSGYPQGLKGNDILLEARIMAVADVVEAMSSHRPYRSGLGIDKALAEIERGRGTEYDAAVVDACLRLFREAKFVLPDVIDNV